jgi:ActR/RegA family two-component response regulator
MKRNIFEKTIERRKLLTDGSGASREITVNWMASNRVQDQPTVVETGSKQGMAIRDRIILSVTDDMEFDKRLRMAAVARGQVVIRVDSMDAALRTVRTGCCGVALLDLDLAGQLAWKTADGLLQDAKCPPVVLLSGPSEQLDLKTAVQAGSILDKFGEAELILKAVKDILDSPRSVRASRNATQRALVRWLSPCTWPISGAPPLRYWGINE